MVTPEVTEEWFDECKSKGLTSLATLGRLNVQNTRSILSPTIPKALREDDNFNAYLVIKNHKGKYKFMGMRVEDKAGCLHIVMHPEFIWTGYVNYGKQWYYVNAHDLIKGKIRADHKIIVPQIEYDG